MANIKGAKASDLTGGSTRDDSAYWILPEGTPHVDCHHEEAKESRNTKKCKECGAKRYKRVSDFIKAGDTPPDYDNLKLRDTRYAVKGILVNEEHVAKALSLPADGKGAQEFNSLTKKAAREYGIWTKAQWGTMLHAWTEDVDNGHSSRYPLADKPDLELFGPAVKSVATSWRDREAWNLFNTEFNRMRKDVQAYMAVSEAHGVTFSHVEAMVVLDKYEVAGKLDRLGNVAPWSPLYCCDLPHVDDTKTGSIDHGKRTKIMQFGAYSLGDLYDPETYARTPHGACTRTAYVMHIPKGDPKSAKLVAFDISRGRELLDLAHDIWKQHAVKTSLKVGGVDPWLSNMIRGTVDRAELKALYERTWMLWEDSHGELAKSKEF